jgi:hypothetical protein
VSAWQCKGIQGRYLNDMKVETPLLVRQPAGQACTEARDHGNQLCILAQLDLAKDLSGQILADQGLCSDDVFFATHQGLPGPLGPSHLWTCHPAEIIEEARHADYYTTAGH